MLFCEVNNKDTPNGAIKGSLVIRHVCTCAGLRSIVLASDKRGDPNFGLRVFGLSVGLTSLGWKRLRVEKIILLNSRLVLSCLGQMIVVDCCYNYNCPYHGKNPNATRQIGHKPSWHFEGVLNGVRINDDPIYVPNKMTILLVGTPTKGSSNFRSRMHGHDSRS